MRNLDPSASPATILLVDDDIHCLQQISTWLATSGYQVVTAASGHGAMILMKRHDVAVVVLDLQLADTLGLTVLDNLREHWPEVPVIIHTKHVSIDIVIHALRRGKAFDFLKKPLADRQVLHDTIKAALQPSKREPGPSCQEEDLDLAALTARERQMLASLSKGFSNQAIAKALSLSEKTVRNRLSSIYAKLGIANRTELLARLNQSQITSPIQQSGHLSHPLAENWDN